MHTVLVKMLQCDSNMKATVISDDALLMLHTLVHCILTKGHRFSATHGGPLAVDPKH